MKNLIILFSFLMSFSLIASESDSASKKSLIVVPIGYYQKETSVALGAAGAYYFKSIDLKKISSLSFSAIYTFNQQFILSFSPKFFSKNKQYYYYADLKARYYPDLYFDKGIGIDYLSKNLHLAFQPQYFLSKNISVGLNYLLRYEDLETEDSSLNIDYPPIWKPYFIQGIGFVGTYDTRDNLYYPNKGFFAKLSTWSATKVLGSDYNLNNYNLDIRQYFSLAKKHIFAYQFYTAHSWGAYIPFTLLSTVGGGDKLRGFREGEYRYTDLILVQTEYRYPIYKRLKGVAFCGVGHLYDKNFFNEEKLKVSYGAGFRFRLNDARVHFRFDYARTNYNENNFYITATEAF